MPKKEEEQTNEENYIMSSFIICIFHVIMLGGVKTRRMRYEAHVLRLGEEKNSTYNFYRKFLRNETIRNT